MRRIFSPNWYRVAQLRLRMKGHVEVHEHVYRDVPWRIVEDRQSGRFHRLTPAAYYFVCLMDGQRSVDEIQQLVEERYLAEAPTQDDAIRLIAQLHAADLLVGDRVPDLSEIDLRAKDHARKQFMSRVKNPMAIRIPLADPDRFIVATLPLVGWMFTRLGFLLWLVLVGSGVTAAALNWPELTENLSDRVLSGQNIFVIALVYPVIKLIHELAHAYAVRRWGGEVHEIGIMFIVLLPVPYVDASAATAYRSWTRRAVVAGAGVFVELGLAAVAVILWTYAEPGISRAVLFNIALIGGVSTLLFNGNPLLRFDGYYMLADAVGIPNLATRANRYLGYLVQRYVFGLETAESPVSARGERAWFSIYAVAAFLYRIVIMIAISLFIATQFFFIGILLALVVILNMLVLPIFKAGWFVISSPAVQSKRKRAVLTAGAAVLAVAALVGVVPMPYATVVQGVVFAPETAHVRAGSAGVVARVETQDGADVTAGTLLIRLEDPILLARRDVQTAELDALIARFRAAGASDLAQAKLIQQEIDAARQELRRLQEQIDALEVRAPRDGRWTITASADLQGLFVGRGEVLGYMLAQTDRSVRAIVPQSSVDLVRTRLEDISLRFSHAPDRSFTAELIAEVPAAGRTLPSKALTTEGGGTFAIDPTAGDGLTTLDPVFQFDLLAQDQARAFMGERVSVRFDHGTEPIAVQVFLSIRRLFLSVLDV